MIRIATTEDAKNLLAIYEPYVRNTAITFEYDVPSITEFTDRIQHTLKKYPYILLEENGQILGYAYASPFKERSAYNWSVETSIYLNKDARGKGYGRQLHDALEKLLKSMGIINMCACIGVPRGEDPYLDNNSVDFHSHMGYRMVGTFSHSGYKFGRWYDMSWMEKHITTPPAHPQPIKTFPDIMDRFDEIIKTE